MCSHTVTHGGDVLPLLQIFRNRIGSVRKALKSRVEFVFLDAPYLAEAADAEEVREAGGGELGRSW